MNSQICPSCGAQNRAGARFCSSCRAPLPASGSRVCPRCGATNRETARFCGQCGFVFAEPAPVPPAPLAPAPAGLPPLRPPALRRASRSPRVLIAAGFGAFLVVALVCVLAAFFARSLFQQAAVSLGASPTAPIVSNSKPAARTATPPGRVAGASPAPSTSNPARGSLPVAERATVRIIVPMDSSRGGAGAMSSIGSGSVISKRGHILTNNHLFVDEQTGRPFNARGEIYVALPAANNPKGDAVPQFRAKMVRQDVANDLALIVVTAREDGGALPTDLGLGLMPIGNSDAVQLGDQVTILGYPGLGGNTLTLTRGIISGFLPDENWIKTDAEINPGNSGGGALNASFELIGVASAGNIGKQFPGKIGLIRPIKAAQTLIALARSSAGE